MPSREPATTTDDKQPADQQWRRDETGRGEQQQNDSSLEIGTSGSEQRVQSGQQDDTARQTGVLAGIPDRRKIKSFLETVAYRVDGIIVGAVTGLMVFVFLVFVVFPVVDEVIPGSLLPLFSLLVAPLVGGAVAGKFQQSAQEGALIGCCAQAVYIAPLAWFFGRVAVLGGPASWTTVGSVIGAVVLVGGVGGVIGASITGKYTDMKPASPVES